MVFYPGQYLKQDLKYLYSPLLSGLLTKYLTLFDNIWTKYWQGGH